MVYTNTSIGSLNNYVFYILFALVIIYVLWTLYYIIFRPKSILYEKTKEVLRIMDSLFAKLPKEEISKFSKTKEYKLYRKILHKYGVR